MARHRCFIENVPRMFSDDLAAEIDESKVPVLPIFKALEKYGEIKHEEMFEIFNMGIGLMLAVKPENVEMLAEEELRKLYAAMSKLTERQQEIIQLYFYKGLTQYEIAEELGIARPVVSKIMTAAIKKLKKSF